MAVPIQVRQSPSAGSSSHPNARRRAGARLALGSDAPVESLDPLKGFYAAVTRLWPNGDSPHGSKGWYDGTLSAFPISQTLNPI